MVKNDGRQYRLTPAAQNDLRAIWQYTKEQWSIEQADSYTDTLVEQFARLCFMPEIARIREEFTPPVRIHAHNKHVIVYTFTDKYLDVIRVLGGKQDWTTLLRAIDE